MLTSKAVIAVGKTQDGLPHHATHPQAFPRTSWSSVYRYC